MNDDMLQDLKQFITVTVSQQLAIQTDEINSRFSSLEQRIDGKIESLDKKLSKKIDDLSQSVADAMDANSDALISASRVMTSESPSSNKNLLNAAIC